MDARSLIEMLKGRGLSFYLEGERVKVEAPQEPDVETQMLVNELRERKAEVMAVLLESDPIVPVEAWFPVFSVYFRQVAEQIKNLDLGLVRKHRPDLFAEIRAKENEIDALGSAPLSKIMDIITKWRGLLLEAHFQQKEHERERSGGAAVGEGGTGHESEREEIEL